MIYDALDIRLSAARPGAMPTVAALSLLSRAEKVL